MELQVRNRRPPVAVIYGEYADQIFDNKLGYSFFRDRAAYMYIVGEFPSHLRKDALGFLRKISVNFRMPTSLDGRLGSRKILDEVAEHLQLEQHKLVQEVRDHIRRGYFIQASLGFGKRKNYGKVFMFKMGASNAVIEKITIYGNGASKHGWD